MIHNLEPVKPMRSLRTMTHTWRGVGLSSLPVRTSSTLRIYTLLLDPSLSTVGRFRLSFYETNPGFGHLRALCLLQFGFSIITPSYRDLPSWFTLTH